MERNVRALSVLVLLGSWAVPVLAQLDPANARKFEVALIGDIPYSGLQVLQYPNVIADINANKVDFTVHVGDIKAGNTVCSDDVYPAVRDSFNAFHGPLIYTPGDNEWTDCHRRNNGSYDPLERLALIREVFYPSDRSLGATTFGLQRQSERQPFATYRENAMWSMGSALFVTVHVVGSNNGLNQTLSCTPTPADPCQNPYAASMNAEYAARNAANSPGSRRRSTPPGTADTAPSCFSCRPI